MASFDFIVIHCLKPAPRSFTQNHKNLLLESSLEITNAYHFMLANASAALEFSHYVAFKLSTRAGRSLKLLTLIRSVSKDIQFVSVPDPVCNQISESGSAPDPDKILLLCVELILNTKRFEVAFFLKVMQWHFVLRAMLKLDHLSVLFQELCVEGNRCFDVVFR